MENDDGKERHEKYQFSNPTVRVEGRLIIEDFSDIVVPQEDDSKVPPVAETQPAKDEGLPSNVFPDEQGGALSPSEVLVIAVHGAEKDVVCEHILPILFDCQNRLPSSTSVIAIVDDEYQSVEIKSRCLQNIGQSAQFETLVAVGVEGAVKEIQRIEEKFDSSKRLHLMVY